MRNDDTTPAEVAALDAMLAQIDADLAASLERIAALPEEVQQFAAAYADLSHRMRRTVAMWQFETATHDKNSYRQALLGVASDMVVSALAVDLDMGKAQRFQVFLDHQNMLFKRLLKIGAIPMPSPRNQARFLGSDGQPMKRRTH